MIHYDVTDIWEYARHNATLSGIQRVSIQILNRIVNSHGADSLRLIGWHPIKKRILSFDPAYFSGEYAYDQDHFCRHFGLSQITTSRVDLRAYLKRKYGGSWKRPVHHARLRLMNSLTGGQTFAKRDITDWRPPRRTLPIEDGVSLTAGDLIFIVGATWNFEDYLSALARERQQRGVAICHFVHDLVPLLTPEHVGDNVPGQFARWLAHLSRNTDHFLTNSLATRRDLDAWLAEHGASVPTAVLPLAHQFADSPRQYSLQPASADEAIHARVLNAARLPFVLCVGTIESRKNIWTLTNVWRRIYAQLGEDTPRLVFAGKHGSLKEDFDDFIKGTGSLYGYIRIIERPSDAELAFLYRRCLFSAFPSYKEGWGLPVGEGLWFGRPVVCSNTSSMPEVGGSLADYVDPASWRSIEAAVLKMITDAAYREQRAAEIAAARLRTWADVADDLWRELMAIGTLQSRHDTAAALARPRQLSLQDAR
jgi:glycosyltransferase involved in cell wall biosynthesis